MSDISYYRGDTEPIVFTVKDSTGAPVNIDGWEFILTVNSEKAPADEANQIFQLTGVVDTDPTTGRVTFSPDIEDTDHVGTFYYDIQRTDESGKIKTLIAGYKFKLSQDITKI